VLLSRFHSFWIWKTKGTKFTRSAELRVEAERLSHGQMVQAEIGSGDVSGEKGEGSKEAELNQIEYKA
jgi:hypothetical protein